MTLTTPGPVRNSRDLLKGLRKWRLAAVKAGFWQPTHTGLDNSSTRPRALFGILYRLPQHVICVGANFCMFEQFLVCLNVFFIDEHDSTSYSSRIFDFNSLTQCHDFFASTLAASPTSSRRIYFRLLFVWRRKANEKWKSIRMFKTCLNILMPKFARSFTAPA